MSKSAYVYSGILSSSGLRELIQSKLQNSTQLSWDLAHLDFTDELREAGSAFTSKAEIRWRKSDDMWYRVLILSDEPLELPAEFRQLPGDWRGEEMEKITLIDLCSLQFNPQFSMYPNAESKANIRCVLLYLNDIPIFVSPREVMSP